MRTLNLNSLNLFLRITMNITISHNINTKKDNNSKRLWKAKACCSNGSQKNNLSKYLLELIMYAFILVPCTFL